MKELTLAANVSSDPSTVGGTPQIKSVSRSSYTAVLNALRGGASFGDIKALAPGIQAEDLLFAYNDLRKRLNFSVEAWMKLKEVLLESGSADLLLEQAEELATAIEPILVVPAKRLRTSSQFHSAATVRVIMIPVGRAVILAHRRAQYLEQQLEDLTDPPYRDYSAVTLGKALYNPYAESAYTDHFYIPDRVASIDAPRARALLYDTIFEEG